MAEEQLFELRNLVAVGSFQAAINEGLSLDKLPDPQRQERDVLVYRAYLGKGDHVTVLHEVKEGAPPALLAVRCLARYLGEEGQREAALAAIKQLQAEQPSQETVLLLAATMYLHEGNYDEAFRALHHSTSLECRALLVQAYLKIDRADLAQKELANLQQIDEDATLTQLATAWVDLTLGGEKLEEAFYIFNELIEKWNPTALLLNGVASTHLHRADNAEEAKKAEKLLLQALEKNPNDGETLVNLVCCYQHMGKSRDIINRYMSQIKTRAPRHAWVQEVDILEASFDRHAARFSASKSS